MSSDTMPRTFVPKPKQKIANDRDYRPENAEAAGLPKTVVNAHVVSLRLLFTAWITHFRSLGYIKDTTMDMLDQTVLKRSIHISVRDFEAREAIGGSKRIWRDMVELFRAANASLEQRSYSPPDLAAPSYEGPSSNIIVANNITLLKDLQRLESILAMARNVLTAGHKVQNMAAQMGFDREVCAMINLCIKITARGYDGDGTPLEEDKWQGVINGFKKLLITCLQFLSNLVTLNERLKLMLWVELFDNGNDKQALQPVVKERTESEGSARQVVRMSDVTRYSAQQKIYGLVETGAEIGADLPLAQVKPLRPLTPYFIFLAESRDKIRESLRSEDIEPSTKQIVREATRMWHELTDKERATWKQLHFERLEIYNSDMEAWEAAGKPNVTAGDLMDSTNETVAEALGDVGIGNLSDEPISPESTRRSSHESNLIESPSKLYPDLPTPTTQPAEPAYRMVESAADGARKLQQGKNQLLKRLENLPPEVDQLPFPEPMEPPIQSPTSPFEESGPADDSGPADVADEFDGDESEEDEDSDEDDYAIPGEDGRGLLTDVPLILGPNEIEVLPMIIMSGVVAPADNSLHPDDGYSDPNTLINMYTVRCHLLLAQDNGRNLLRELLIFVAAWDLREEELYFKFMVKILEAILLNGLMPFAYGAFKESKDIISPAQAVIMKLLTKIFHSRQGFITSSDRYLLAQPDPAAPPVAPPIRLDIQIVHCLFSEFRQNIIPQICALIFLQGQIRMEFAQIEDFPLNLWDMERMYEGVYQYLEFFAILTDHEQWKHLMADWEVTSEMITLLRELEVAIPKGRLRALSQNRMGLARPAPLQTSSTETVPEAPVAVERPYDVDDPRNSSSMDETGGAPEATELPGTSYTPEQMHDEPADFEWRNLKKLCVLVLSSLVWKNRRLQDQVRDFGGIPTILSCCKYDEHNPYIREHAIMCLRFMLEGNRENQDVVKDLQEQGRKFKESGQQGLMVPTEVLDEHGYETFIDARGQVGLRQVKQNGR